MSLVPVTLQQVPPSVLTKGAQHAIAQEIKQHGPTSMIDQILDAALDPSDNIYWVSREAYQDVFGEAAA